MYMENTLISAPGPYTHGYTGGEEPGGVDMVSECLFPLLGDHMFQFAKARAVTWSWQSSVILYGRRIRKRYEPSTVNDFQFSDRLLTRHKFVNR